MVLVSKWADALDEKHPWQEYPRPQLRRQKWLNLNGVWQYQIVQGDEAPKPALWLDICVPFGVGAPLSMAPHIIEPGETLWYRRSFAARPGLNRILLNFESVDQNCTVYLNQFECGHHEGGGIPFSFEVGQYIKYQNALMIKVTDDTDEGIWSYGKQSLSHGGLWHTPVAGITGTVWLEELGEHAVEDVKITPDYDQKMAYIELAGGYGQAKITITAPDGSFNYAGLTQDGHYAVPMGNFHPWSCEDPFLYDVTIETEDDTVKTYFGMRQFAKGRDSQGHMRFYLNHKPLFLNGVLDQGWWPDGMLTYPSDEAMVYELNMVKKLGFNMVRKHMKIENRRYYYHCDQMGILVMQDMPCGGTFRKKQSLLDAAGLRSLRKKDNDYAAAGRNADSVKAYQMELDGMLDMLYNCTCIFAWVPFHEGWGQFDSAAIVKRITSYDNTRLIDHASGWYDQGIGDFKSCHIYSKHLRMMEEDGRIVLLSQFGRYGYHSTAHETSEKTYGPVQYKDRVDYSRAVIRLYDEEILPLVEQGLGGCIYEQLSDVEDEDTGLLTGDRAAVKVNADELYRVNMKIKEKMKYER